MTQVNCPQCGRRGSSNRVIAPGTKVRCPACSSTFVPVAFSESLMSSSPKPPEIMVATQRPLVNCPHCSEKILSTARKCKHCGEWLVEERPAIVEARTPTAQGGVVIHNTIVNSVGSEIAPSWNRLVAIILSLILPGLGQLYKGQVINGIVWFIATVIGYAAMIVPGLVLHLLCICGAAMGDPRR